MKEAWNFADCVSVLRREIELLRNISAAQNKVRQAVMSREWTDFDEKLAEVNRMGAEFTALENERNGLFSTLDKNAGNQVGAEKKPFFTLIAGFLPEERKELARLYVDLKTETLKLQAMNDTFLAYINEAKTVAASYIEAVCPARSGKLYTRKGHRVSQDLRSMVFNDRF